MIINDNPKMLVMLIFVANETGTIHKLPDAI